MQVFFVHFRIFLVATVSLLTLFDFYQWNKCRKELRIRYVVLYDCYLPDAKCLEDKIYNIAFLFLNFELLGVSMVVLWLEMIVSSYDTIISSHNTTISCCEMVVTSMQLMRNNNVLMT